MAFSKISDNECKISQYADDTTLILDGTRPSIERSFVLLNIFAKLSGLKVNYEKTEALWIGSFKNRTDKLVINQNIKWSFQKVKSLGVWFSISNCKEEAVLYISQNFIMARFAVFERIKLHQIFKAASILLSRLTQAFVSFSFKSLARFLLILSFVGRSDVTKGTFLVPHFWVPIDYKRTNFFTR